MRGSLTALVITLGFEVIPGTVAAQSDVIEQTAKTISRDARDDAKPALTVLLINRANVPDEVVIAAQAETSRIFLVAGVMLAWRIPDDQSTSSLSMVVTSGRGPLTHLRSKNVMGFASLTRSGGKIAYAFYDRITQVAGSNVSSVVPLLAYVMAHEIGHLLLGPDHSLAGIMRDHSKVEPDQLDSVARRFPKNQSDAIRAAVRAAR